MNILADATEDAPKIARTTTTTLKFLIAQPPPKKRTETVTYHLRRGIIESSPLSSSNLLTTYHSLRAHSSQDKTPYLHNTLKFWHGSEQGNTLPSEHRELPFSP
jgi:hypothetical protein